MKRYEVVTDSKTKRFFTYAMARKYFDSVKRFSRVLYWHSKTGSTVIAMETGTDVLKRAFPLRY